MTPTAIDLPRTPTATSVVFALVSSLMIGLAAGALWLLLVMAHPGPLAGIWIALPAAVLLGLVIRHWVLGASAIAALLAAAAMLLAAAYMRFLLAAAQLSGMFGMDFLQAFRHAGASMLLHLAWLSVTPFACGIYLVSALLAAAVAAPLTRS